MLCSLSFADSDMGVRVGWEDSLAVKEVCRVAERRLSLRTVPPEVASSGAETCNTC